MDPKRLQRAVVQQLQSLENSGVRQVKKRKAAPPAATPPNAIPPNAAAPPSLPAAAARPAKPALVDAGTPAPATLSPAAPMATSTPASTSERLQPIPGDSLDIIRAEVAICTRCAELRGTRTQTVFGVGNPHARLCFLGEAPGADEDRQGEPFVGRAGQLLDKIIAACKLQRDEVYILNVLKCRPPGNRNPLPSEAAACRGFLERQLSLIQPEFLCCLGSIAAQTLLDTERPIGKLRGSFHEYRGIRVVCTYHPAYLLRNPPAKRFVWDDMKMLMREMGVVLE